MDTGMAQQSATYPSLQAAFAADQIAALKALGHNEAFRANVAQTAGLEHLCILDQYARCLLTLGISNRDDANKARRSIEAALASFMFRGILTGQAPTPTNVKNAILRIGASFTSIGSDLALLMTARRDVGIGEETRAEALEQIQYAILGSIAADLLPQALASKFTYDEVADAMPSVSNAANKQGYNDQWAGRFNKVGQRIGTLAASFDGGDFAKPRRTFDIHFTRFIGQLAGIFTIWTGQSARSPDRNANQPQGWRGPFSRFVEAVWPLTPEGSGGLGNNCRCPTNKRIRDALNQSALLANTELSK